MSSAVFLDPDGMFAWEVVEWYSARPSFVPIVKLVEGDAEQHLIKMAEQDKPVLEENQHYIGANCVEGLKALERSR